MHPALGSKPTYGALTRRKPSTVATPPRYSLTRLLLELTLARLLLTLGALLTPFRGLLSLSLFMGRATLAGQRNLLRLVGWLAAHPRLPWARQLGGGLVSVRRWHIVAAAVALTSAVSAALRAWRLLTDETHQQRQRLMAKMAMSRSYFEWCISATKLDALEGVDQTERWRRETRLYDRQLLQEKVLHLRRVGTSGQVADQMFAVRADLIRDLGHMTNSELQAHFPVVPEAIREYTEEVKSQLEHIARCPDLPLDERAAFLKETRHAFGRTALLLSGGGALAPFHLGVARALAEHALLPRVLAGSSGAALPAALLATRTDAELSELLGDLSQLDLPFLAAPAGTPSLSSRLLPAWASGDAAAAAADAGLKRLRHMLGDLTFIEAFRRTGRVLNLAVPAGSSGSAGSEPPRLLNYLTAPHVVIWSAVAGAVGLPRALLARNAARELVKLGVSSGGGKGGSGWGGSGGWGGDEELPMQGLSEMFSVNHCIVSQASPTLAPLLNAKRRAGWVGTLAEAELRHRSKQLAAVLPRWCPPSRWLHQLAGTWEGNVTITPPDSLLLSLSGPQRAALGLGPPGRAALAEAARAGELAAWARLSAIQANCGIESKLDSLIVQIAALERHEERAAAEALQPLKGRAPSWPYLPGAAARPGSPRSLQPLKQLVPGVDGGASTSIPGLAGGVPCMTPVASSESIASLSGGGWGWGAGGHHASMPDLLSALASSTVPVGAPSQHRWWLEAGENFFSDAEDHLPLPEERPHHASGHRPSSAASGASGSGALGGNGFCFMPLASLECTDSSAMGIVLGGGKETPAPAPAGRHLDVIAP